MIIRVYSSLWEVYFASRFHRHIPAPVTRPVTRPRPQLPSCCEAHQGSGCQQGRRAWHANGTLWSTRSRIIVWKYEKIWKYRHARLYIIYIYIQLYTYLYLYIIVYIHKHVYDISMTQWFDSTFWILPSSTMIYSDITVILQGLQGWKMASVVPAKLRQNGEDSTGNSKRIQQDICRKSLANL